MDITKEILVLCSVLDLSEKELGEELGVRVESINNWKNKRIKIDDNNLEKFYSYAFSKGISFSKVYSDLSIEETTGTNNIVLFHGSKKGLHLPIDIDSNSKHNNDFGKGFYLGETFEGASNYISVTNSHMVYSFLLDKSDLNIYKLDVDNDWMLLIAYYRGRLNKYSGNNTINDLIKKVEEADVVIAPIADNRMFDIIDEFVDNLITDMQCKYSLFQTNLGNQYVLRTNKAISHLMLLDELYLPDNEKEYYYSKIEYSVASKLDAVSKARIEYKNKGKYIDEVLK